ncbi:MAG: LamG domain-containing protein [Bacteroidales bacterium]|nr:LamG domain-containing protein [Bacteroidales bacterium]
MRESIYSKDIRCIFREVFNSEQDVIRNGVLVGSAAFINNGLITLIDDVNSYVDCKKLINKICSVRFKIKPIDFHQYQYLADFRHSGGIGCIYININNGIVFVSSGNIYVDGVQTNVVTAGVYNEIVVVGININCTKLVFFAKNDHSVNQMFGGEVDLIEVYGGVLSTEEISNLYNNKAYKETLFKDEVLSIDSRLGEVIDRWGNSIINTDVDIIRDGYIYNQYYNGITSLLAIFNNVKLNFGEGNFSILVWIKATVDNTVRYKVILGKTETENKNVYRLFLFSSNGYPYLRIANGLTWIDISYFQDLRDNVWHLVCVTVNRSGNGIMYVDACAGTPVSLNFFLGSIDNINNLSVGFDSDWGVANAYFEGAISVLKFVKKELTAEQISQIFMSTKNYYGL